MTFSRPVTVLLVLAGLAAGGLAVVAVTERAARDQARRELAGVREEIGVRLGRAERHRERVVVRAPFATWAHLVAGLHGAAAASGLDRFRYTTLGVVPLDDPTAPLPVSDAKREANGENTGGMAAPGPDDGGRPHEKHAERPAPYRAMRARVEGGGTYGQVVSFVHALAAADPPLFLDRIVVRAGPEGPTFEAWVHLVTALPVEAPRVVALDRVPPEGLPPAVGEALAGLVPPAPAPAAGEETR